MKNDVWKQASDYMREYRQKKCWHKIVTFLAAVVVFCTTYALILPAITMERGNCGIPEHTHTEKCYRKILPERELVCTFPEILVHSDSNSCMEVHNDDCYAITRGALICTDQEESMTASDSNAETKAHQHTDSCYEWERELICEKTEEKESREPETGKTEVVEHVHTDECFRTVGNVADPDTLTCEIPEDENHTHSALCYGTWELICDKEEHTHTLACYADLTADVESPSNWEATLPEQYTGEWRQDVLSVAESQLGYTESTENYLVEEDGTTTRGYTRYGAWYGDPYGDWCAMFASFCLHYADVPEDIFPQEGNCARWIAALRSEELNLYREAQAKSEETMYIPEPGDLVFFDKKGIGVAGHVGIVAEVIPAAAEQTAQIRTIEGNSGNRVRYVTYDLGDSEILGYGVLPDQGFTCKTTGHIHGSKCKNSQGEIICGLEEHIHTEGCRKALAELIYRGPDYTVCVAYGEEAKRPEHVELRAEEIPADSEEYKKYYEEAAAAVGAGTIEEEETGEDAGEEAASESGEKAEAAGDVFFARFFDIQLLSEGQEVEPAEPVTVTITYDEPVETGDQVTCQAIHFGEDGTEILEVETQVTDENNTSFTHKQNSFSVVGNVLTINNSVDHGPESLVVDYYVCIDDEWTCVGSTKTGWYGDYENPDNWEDSARDYITVAQAASVLGEKYGFNSEEDNPARRMAYQVKEGSTEIYSDTTTIDKDGNRIIPLTKDPNHCGYNLYYLPKNTEIINSAETEEQLDKAENSFYTVMVYDAMAELLNADLVLTGGHFSLPAVDAIAESWIVSYGNGTTETITGNSIELNNITSPVKITPGTGEEVEHSVTFKVMIDGQWQTVGTLPYYYFGSVNESQRAYITSGMAAQFFGDFGYDSKDDPGYQFGYSYNDIYTIYYAQNTGFCMDVSGGKIEQSQPVQLWTSNESAAQIFRIWDSGDGYNYITPIANSAYHVNVLGGGTTDGTKLGIHTATDAASHWKVVTNSDGTVSFYNKNAPESAVIDLPGGTVTKGSQLQIWNDGGYRYWKLVQRYWINNDTVSSQNSDGTWNIGLTTESNGDIVCYYLPGETDSTYHDAAESDIANENSFWSVSVKDDTHSVYSDGELSGMVQYAARGDEATVTVKNADGILWSVAGAEAGNVITMQSGGDTTFVIKNITQPIEVVATRANPAFTVQYYANIDHYVLSDSGNLDVIDTSGKKLPSNSASQPLRWLTLEQSNQNTDQNKGTATPLHSVKSEKQLTQMYSDGTFNFDQHPGLEYFDKLWGQSNYKLDSVLVLKDGKSPDSMNDDDWWWYQINQTTWGNITFTNLASEERAPRQEGVKQGRDGNYCILLQENTVIRLRYETGSGTYTNQANFHDYDITSGQNTNGTWRSGITGINKSDNYVTSGNGQRKFNGTHNENAAADVFAFGNANCETGLGLAQWGGNNINTYNGRTIQMADGSSPYFGKDVYKGCTFQLVTGVDGNGNLIWDPWITAPYLFNDGTADGKHSYNNGSLQFSQVGDRYTLTAANSGAGSRNGLEYFFNPSPSTSTTHTHIFTNNFWPLDQASNKTDPLMGAINNDGVCDIKVNGFWDEQNTVGESHDGVRVPISDDGRAHNWFFGMNFSLSFTLTEDYMGPLDYIFFGDDDMWVFLDKQLICDIGGVHSSVGEYVNLRDYLPNGSSGQHTLTFYYTERGASGSTCWMSFTLPSVTSATTGRDIGSLQISKSVDCQDDSDFGNEVYQFQVELLTSENGSALDRTFSCTKANSKDSSVNATYGTLKSGGTVNLKKDENVTIKGIPAGTFYRVTELTHDGYMTTVNGNEGYIVSGNVSNGATSAASFINKPYFALPQTGGPGTTMYTIGGLLFISAGISILLLYNIIKRRKEELESL